MVNGRIAAKAQVVTSCPPFSYVSDMLTESASRRKGLGSALLRRLHIEARARGAREMLLVPSLMARQLRFYEGHCYEAQALMVLLIPADVPHGRNVVRKVTWARCQGAHGPSPSETGLG
jgi:GNAT superfamily N-acetyltransferase